MMWLSFADKNPPEGKGFLGACIVAGDEIVEAVREAHRLGINPGGEVLGQPIPDHVAPRVPAKWQNRLLTRAEIKECEREMFAILGTC